MPRPKPAPPSKCSTHPHPEPTESERARMYEALAVAATEINAAFSFANKTPSYHHLTEDLGAIAAIMVRLGRTA